MNNIEQIIKEFDREAKKAGLGGLARLFCKTFLRNVLTTLEAERIKEVEGVIKDAIKSADESKEGPITDWEAGFICGIGETTGRLQMLLDKRAAPPSPPKEIN